MILVKSLIIELMKFISFKTSRLRNIFVLPCFLSIFFPQHKRSKLSKLTEEIQSERNIFINYPRYISHHNRFSFELFLHQSISISPASLFRHNDTFFLSTRYITAIFHLSQIYFCNGERTTPYVNRTVSECFNL